MFGGMSGRMPDRRQRPPHPLGLAARYFPYSATTPVSKPQESGLQLRIKISTPHSNMPFRSGEVIEGNVIITRPPASADGKPIPTVKVESLKLQAYFESRNLFWHFDVAQPKTGVEKVKSKIKPGMMQKFESTVGHEVHRGFVRDEDIEMSFRNSGDMVLRFDELGEDSVSLPFAFTIPSRMTVTEWNKQYPNAPRDLCPVERSPPPSYPDSPIASVQWVVEAVLELDKSTEVEVDDRMFKQPNPSVVVTRIVFPFLPKDSDAQDLSTVPYFGRDLSEDMFKAAIVWEGDASEVKRLPPGRTGTWRTYEKIIKLNEGSLMNAEAALYAQLSIPSPTLIPRSAATLPLILSLSLKSPEKKGLAIKRSIKPVTVKYASVALKRQVSVRGGKDIEPHNEIDVIRGQSLTYEGGGGASSSSAKGGIAVQPNQDPVTWEIEFDLQGDHEVLGSKPKKMSTKVSTLIPSFRTPNVQLEYIINMTIGVEGHGENFVTTFPVQFLAGDSNELPSFEIATGGADGRDDTGVAPPAYAADT